MQPTRMKKALCSTLLVVAMSSVGWVNSAHGGFGEMSLAARSVGMGRAFVAVADDPTAVFYNPAGLVQVDALGIHTTYGQLYPGIDDGGINVADVVVAVPLGDVLTFGGAASTLSVPCYSQSIFYGSVARRLPLNLAVGLNVKLLRWSANGYFDPETGVRDKDFSKTTISFDAGVLYSSPELSETFVGRFLKSGRIQAGLRLSDVTRPSVADDGSESGKLPMSFDAGLAYLTDTFALATSVSHRDGRTRTRLGCEFVAMSVLSSQWATRLLLRGGGTRILSNHEGGEVDVGFGIAVRGVSIDYAYLYPLALQETGGSHRVSLGYSF